MAVKPSYPKHAPRATVFLLSENTSQYHSSQYGTKSYSSLSLHDWNLGQTRKRKVTFFHSLSLEGAIHPTTKISRALPVFWGISHAWESRDVVVVNAVPKQSRRRVWIVLPQGDLASSLREGRICEYIELVKARRVKNDQSPHCIRRYKKGSIRKRMYRPSRSSHKHVRKTYP